MNENKSRIEELENEGWKKQFVACEPRLSEAVELYKETGYDVHLEPLLKEAECESCAGEEGENESECRICFEGVEEQYKVIFTKPNKGGTESEDDLF